MIAAKLIAWGMLAGLLTYIGLPFYVQLQKEKDLWKKAVAAGDPNADELKPRWFDEIILLFFGIADVFFNVTIGTAMFADLPFQKQAGHREVTYSQRLKRLILDMGWRGNRARWVAETFIYRTDPSHLS